MSPTNQTSVTKRTVAVLGGGVAGLTVAHELALTGEYAVTVFEQRGPRDHPDWLAERAGSQDALDRAVLGGKAWSYATRQRGSFGANPPAEHGFRFFPGFY